MIAQPVIELDNIIAHCHLPVLDRHTPFFQCFLDCLINHFPHRIIHRKYFTFLDDTPEFAVL
ncbi:hypothetical protein NL87_25005 [Salmonella enterica]|nr:hypothetical protein [Salmonella enterica subsp. diarizonae]EAM3004221.1 hypothetical protein [Salmonella enterica]EAW1164445.1 hypothetical protein [Salmonella enterica subsp. enterica]EDS4951330.1 hypothetical protein [Salmonella enterica subsp. enterica serovar Redlands]EDX2475662.1 hypothetical protein [Salmonella enterica subsp. diarizonae serovar 16:z10:e,n,x,z15]EGE4753244.1 hypothetical protein [Salmonella enterica subsp. diarizonae serovar 38:[k]:z35]